MSAEDVSYVTSQLTRKLSRHGQVRGTKRRISCASLPFTTTAKYDHVELRKLMAPPVPDDGILTEQLLDAFLYPLIDGEGTPEQGLLHIGGEKLTRFVMIGNTLEEQTVRLLFACSTADGATHTLSEDTFLIQHSQRIFGIDGGRIVSRFCSSIRMQVDPLAILSKTEEMRIHDASFCSLYREAMRRGRGLPAALIALRIGNPGAKFKRMADAADASRHPGPGKLRQWEEILNDRYDPVGKLYQLVVPKWMNASSFHRVFGSIAARPVNPRPQTITNLINRMHQFFNQIGTNVL